MMVVVDMWYRDELHEVAGNQWKKKRKMLFLLLKRWTKKVIQIVVMVINQANNSYQII